MYFQSVDELNEHVKNDHKEDNAEHICDTCSQLYCSLRVLGIVHYMMFSRFLNLRKIIKKFVFSTRSNLDKKCGVSPWLVRFFGPQETALSIGFF